MTAERQMLVNRIAQKFYDDNPAWLTGPQRREVAAIAVDGLIDWIDSDGPTCIAPYLATMRPEDRLTVLAALSDCVGPNEAGGKVSDG